MPAASGPIRVLISLLRVLVRRSRDLCRISFNVTVGFSVGWFSHMFSGYSRAIILHRFLPRARFVELLRKDVLDPMNSHGHIRGRQTRDFAMDAASMSSR